VRRACLWVGHRWTGELALRRHRDRFHAPMMDVRMLFTPWNLLAQSAPVAQRLLESRCCSSSTRLSIDTSDDFHLTTYRTHPLSPSIQHPRRCDEAKADRTLVIPSGTLPMVMPMPHAPPCFPSMSPLCDDAAYVLGRLCTGKWTATNGSDRATWRFCNATIGSTTRTSSSARVRLKMQGVHGQYLC